MRKLVFVCLILVLLSAHGCARWKHHAGAHGENSKAPGLLPLSPGAAAPQQPSEELKARTDQLLKQLGSEQYRERESAHAQLCRLLCGGRGGIVLERLRAERKTTEDPEVQLRLGRILKPYNDWQVTPAVLNAFPNIVELLKKVPGERAKSIAGAMSKLELKDTSSAPMQVLRLLIQALLSNDEPGRAAVKIVVDIGKPAAEPLVALLEDDDEDVRHFAARALAEMGDPRAAGFLVKALKEGSNIVTVNTLVKLGQPAVETLVGALKDSDEGVRWSCALALGEIRDKRAVGALVEALKDDSSRVRWVVVESLGKIGDRKATNALTEALNDKDKYVREFAAKALGNIGDENAVKPLIEALGDDIWQVRWSVAHALGEIGGKDAIEPLIECLKDKERRVRKAAAEALTKITKQDFFLDYKDWKQWYEKNKDKQAP